SVPPEGGDGHSSGPPIAGRFSRPTRTPQPVRLLANERGVPIRSCSRRGLPCRPCRQVRGGLLPHPFTLTPQDRSPAGRFALCGALPGIAPGGRYPPPFHRGARTFLEPPKRPATARPSGPGTHGRSATCSQSGARPQIAIGAFSLPLMGRENAITTLLSRIVAPHHLCATVTG